MSDRLLAAGVSRRRCRQRPSHLRPRRSALSRVSRGTSGPSSCRSRGIACGRAGLQRSIPTGGRLATAEQRQWVRLTGRVYAVSDRLLTVLPELVRRVPEPVR